MKRTSGQSFYNWDLFPNQEVCTPALLTPEGAVQQIKLGERMREAYLEKWKLLPSEASWDKSKVVALIFNNLEYIPVGCVPTAGLPYGRGSAPSMQTLLHADPPPCRPPPQPPPKADPPSKGRPPFLPRQTPPPPGVDRMTDAGENITFPHTSYAFGNKKGSFPCSINAKRYPTKIVISVYYMVHLSGWIYRAEPI